MKDKHFDRREFLKASSIVGLTGWASLAFGGVSKIINPLDTVAGTVVNPEVDIVAIRGGQPDFMFKKAIEAFGGMQQIVKPGNKVVVKPNIGWNVTPERGANTNPVLVREIVKECLRVGAKEVYVFDHTADVWTKCYKNSGIEQAVKDAKGKMVPGNNERDYRKISIENAIKLKTVKVHDLIFESDVFINVPILKHHISTKVSLGMKNLMGIMWDRQWWHKNDLHQCIADFASYIKPDLTIMDAYYVMKQNGPMGVSVDDVLTQKALLLGKDPLAIDIAAAKMFGHDPEDVGYIRLASKMKVGASDLSSLNIKKIKI